MTITAAADGSSLGNPGPAGWAWVVSENCWDAGGWDEGTNNLGELTAVLKLLRATEAAGLAGEPLHVLADSQYAINVITKWRHGWKKRGWTKADRKPIANLDLIKDIDEAISGRQVTFEWVRGHAGHALNERADDLARGAAQTHKDGGVAAGGPGFGGHATRATGMRRTEPAPDRTDAPGTDEPLPVEAGSPRVAAWHGQVHDSDRQDAAADATTPSRPAPTGEAGDADSGPRLTGTTPSPEEKRAVVRAEHDFLRAWVDGDAETLDALAAPGATRVWPEGRVSETLAGPAPESLRISPITVRPAGRGAWLATSYVLLGDSLTVATSLWIRGEGASLRLLHHQTTPVSALREEWPDAAAAPTRPA